MRAFLLGLFVLHSLAQPPKGDDLLEEANSNYRQLHSAEAVRLYRQYLQLYPKRADVHVFLGAALLNMNQLDDALAEADNALALNPKLAKAYVLKSRAYTEQQRWDSALQCFHIAVSLEPGDSDAWYFGGPRCL